ncbi:MAG: formylglycine-generating enzyme family protein [Thermoguttaceae bacterium]|nr:formylglycine-generating enzyme family protein [Thermoguttaceae bacterium]
MTAFIIVCVIVAIGEIVRYLLLRNPHRERKWRFDRLKRVKGGTFDPNATEAGERRVMEIAGVEFAFRYCPPGEFLMGSPEDEPEREDVETQHKVVLTRGFWLMESPLTQKQWKAVAGFNPSKFKGENLPVETISWNDCDKFVKTLNEKLSELPEGWRFSLPTEAQWEYACRAGTTTPFPWGNSLNGDNANCDGNYPYGTEETGTYLKKTTPVGSYWSNDWGLYDMCGNVYEWCLDYYGEYPKGEVVDPARLDSGDEKDWDDDGNTVWEKGAGSDRVRRGGCWGSYAVYCRSAYRNWYDADRRNYIALGARLALVPTFSR